MRELSEQEIKKVSGGTAGLSPGLGPLGASTIGQNIEYFTQRPIVVPQFNIFENFFTNNPDS